MSREYNDDQLRPFKTPNSNAVLKGPPGTDVGDLDCELMEDPEFGSVVTGSAWELTEEQRAKVAAGAHIRLSVWQHPIPPLAVAVEAPFCKGCGAEMEFQGVGFACLKTHSEEEDAEAALRRDFSPQSDDQNGSPSS